MDELPINWGQVARCVLLSRELDLFEEQHLAPQGKVKNQFSAKGHELSQVLLAQALDHRHDAATVYYRSRPLLLASGLSAADCIGWKHGAHQFTQPRARLRCGIQPARGRWDIRAARFRERGHSIYTRFRLGASHLVPPAGAQRSRMERCDSLLPMAGMAVQRRMVFGPH